ncbi:hypothetical protein [Amycolatopsis sp. NPDC021455]|uniref:hypothetical protein n=1 Tax=Amycolatopsis sp. NPDC021455 TaxID=3154901 RepID=UPI00340E6AF6
MRRLFTGLLLLLTATGGAVVTAGTAQATDGAGCPDEAVCYGWSRNWDRPDGGRYGAISYFADGNNEACDLKLDPYLGSGAGSGTAIGNNNGSLMVNKLNHTVTFYYSPAASGCRRPGGYSQTYGFGVRTCNSNPDTDWGVLPWYLCNNTRSHFVN